MSKTASECVTPSEGHAIVRRGARFMMGANCLEELEDFLSEDCPIPKKYHAMLATLGALCEKDPESKTDAHALAHDADLALQTIHVYADQLVALGLFTKQSLRPKNRGRPATLFTLINIDTFLQGRGAAETFGEPESFDAGSLVALHNIGPEPIEEQGEDPHFGLLPVQPGVYRADILSTYTLLSVLRLGKSGRRTRGSYTSDVHVGPAKMRIRVAAQEGFPVAGIIDTKALIGLCTYAKSFYSNPSNLGKPLVIDLADFTAYLGYEASGGNKRQVWKMCRTWEKTGYTVVYADDAIRRLYGQDAFTVDEFRFITRIKTLVKGVTPERFAITLDKGLLDRILDKQSRFLSAIHQEIMREKSATCMLVYYWCRRAVQYNTTPVAWDIFHLHREMAPYMELGEFRENLESIIAKGEGGRPQPQYGYFLRPIYDAGRLNACEIWANPKDRLIKLYYQHNPQLLQAPEE